MPFGAPLQTKIIAKIITYKPDDEADNMLTTFAPIQAAVNTIARRVLVMRLCVVSVCVTSLYLAGLSSVSADTINIPAVAESKSAALPAPSASARELFSRYKDRVVQVRVLRESANEQSSLGSAFVVRDDGTKGTWLVTNYHVVSSLAIHPDKFRIELRPTSEKSVKATLVAIDVLHDLAVLHTDPAGGAAAWPVLQLRDNPVIQGEKIFSMGNPLEVGFLISEGIYNGLVERRIYEQMVFSGALNAGMSGGPTIDEVGRVVGVNVSTHRLGVLISFLVPIKYARELLDRAWQAAPRKEWRSEIARQLLIHQQFLTDKVLGEASADKKAGNGFGSQTLAGRNVATLDGSLTKCWANGRDGERLRYQRDGLRCDLQAELFVSQNVYTGSLQIGHNVLRNDKLATPQFLALDTNSNLVNSYIRQGGSERTAQECRDEYVQGKAHIYRVAICLQAYKKFDGVYDFSASATQVDDAKERLTSTISLQGLSYENSQRLAGLFLERLQ